MTDPHTLGGARTISPLENEVSYPLTEDEYYTIKEHISTDKLTNWESVLLSTLITSIISGIVTFFSGAFEKHIIKNGIDTVEINWVQIISIIFYGTLSFGSLISFIISRQTKKSSKSSMVRLDQKITTHLSKK